MVHCERKKMEKAPHKNVLRPSNDRSNLSSWRAATLGQKPRHYRSNLILRHRLITNWGATMYFCFDQLEAALVTIVSICLDLHPVHPVIYQFIHTVYLFPCLGSSSDAPLCKVAVVDCSVHFCQLRSCSLAHGEGLATDLAVQVNGGKNEIEPEQITAIKKKYNKSKQVFCCSISLRTTLPRSISSAALTFDSSYF